MPYLIPHTQNISACNHYKNWGILHSFFHTKYSKLTGHKFSSEVFDLCLRHVVIIIEKVDASIKVFWNIYVFQ